MNIGMSRDELRLVTFDAAEAPEARSHPNQVGSPSRTLATPSFNVRMFQTLSSMAAVVDACPYMPTTFGDFIKVAADLGPPSAWDGIVHSGKSQNLPAPIIRRGSLGSLETPVQ